jgi:hypothetical protein
LKEVDGKILYAIAVDLTDRLVILSYQASDGIGFSGGSDFSRWIALDEWVQEPNFIVVLIGTTLSCLQKLWCSVGELAFCDMIHDQHLKFNMWARFSGIAQNVFPRLRIHDPIRGGSAYRDSLDPVITNAPMSQNGT